MNSFKKLILKFSRTNFLVFYFCSIFVLPQEINAGNLELTCDITWETSSIEEDLSRRYKWNLEFDLNKNILFWKDVTPFNPEDYSESNSNFNPELFYQSMKDSDPFEYMILGKTENFIVSAIDLSGEENDYAEEEEGGAIDTLILDLNDNSITSVFHMKENGKPYYYATYTGKCY